MADLRPYPFSALIARMFTELERNEAIFDLPARRFFLGDPDRDFSTLFHGHRAASPLGPAAGPQTQMAQNIVLSWLGGSRLFELKTVQIDDHLTIPRPCIDMRNVGYNAEWSQELELHESLAEYVKGAMLVEMLRASDVLDLEPGFQSAVYDMSVGYDLAGIQSERVGRFIAGMLDARDLVERLRAEIPSSFAHLRDLDFPTRISDTLTLSTFHGCPPQEIERIIAHLMHRWHVHCVVKFNPMLLGKEETHHLLHDVLGYTDVHVPDSAFERDATWDQAVEIVERLGDLADSLGLGFGPKFTNTLIVENRAGFLPAGEKEVYLSGAPLHVLTMHLVRRFRRRFGDRFPVSFSAGIDKENYPDAVALGLVPITVCSDLLKTGGYARLLPYHQRLAKAMDRVKAANLGDFVLTAHGQGPGALDTLGLEASHPRRRACEEALAARDDLRRAAGEDLYARWVSQAKLLNTEQYVQALDRDPRYSRTANTKIPPKIGSHLELFDCVTCDKCVPVCPNDANFTLTLAQREIPVVHLRRGPDGRHRWQDEGTILLEERHQLANFDDFCNDCGNCDVFCPEDGGPYVVKPRFFGSEAAWQASRKDGFHVSREPSGESTRDDPRDVVLGRFERRRFRLEVHRGQMLFTGDLTGGRATGEHRTEEHRTGEPLAEEHVGEPFTVRFDADDPAGTFQAEGAGNVDLTLCFIMDYLRRAVLEPSRLNYVNTLVLTQAIHSKDEGS